jgi:ABC-2 type transport system ATP-binding protein
VNRYDIKKNPDAVRRSVGYVFQDPTLDIELTGRENLDFHGRLYNLGRTLRRQRIEEMLNVVQLTERADDLVKTYSGGMKRRLEIARGLLHHPEVLFLDEPTLGLDPQTRRSIWDHIQNLNQEKEVTIILTTHYTEEADYLCNRILIMDFGKIVALDTPGALKAQLKGDVVSLTVASAAMVPRLRPLLEKNKWIRRINTVSFIGGQNPMGNMESSAQTMTPGSASPHDQGFATPASDKQASPTHHPQAAKQLNLLVDDGGRRIPYIVKLTDEAEVVLESVELHKPTLDDVFISATGRDLRDQRGSFMDMIRRHRIMRQARGRPTPG